LSEHSAGFSSARRGLHWGLPERESREQSASQGSILSPQDTVILLAEDEALVRNLIQLMLVKEGYAVLAAKDGQEALEVLEKFSGPVHLLVTDVRMPRLDGWTLAETVRKQRP
jgi:two-component system cell cycle sensor histidine kinase/response regulator CckA